MGAPWFRFYSEALDDLKLVRASSEAGVEKMSVLGAWAGLLALANGSPHRGRLLLSNDLPLTVPEMALKIGTDAQKLKTIIDAFDGLNMVHWDGDVLVITNWDDRQFKSDHSVDRVRQFRERQKEDDGDDGGDDDSNENETLQDCYSNDGVIPPEQKQNRAESEQNRTEHGANAPPSPKAQRRSSEKSNGNLTEGQRGFLDLFSAKRFANHAQREAVLELERQFGSGKFLEAARWAAEQGMSRGRAIGSLRTALPKWGQPKKPKGKPPPRSSEPAGFQGIRDWLEEEGEEVPT